MKKAFWISAIVAVLLVGAYPLRAASIPSIQGNVLGLELCPQFICGSAIFAALFEGRVGVIPHVGIMAAALNHDPLPELPGQCAAITGGVWELRAGLRRFRGVATGGALRNNGNNTYTVTADFLIVSGGVGQIAFTGILDHNVFPPTITGVVRNESLPLCGAP